MNAIEPNSYAWSSPYPGFWVEHFYSKHFKNLYGRKVVRERDLRRNLASYRLRPEIMLMGNFVHDRVGIVSLCRDAEIETAHAEDGFFPHYSTMHVDPVGFCWESSLPRMIFRKITDSAFSVPPRGDVRKPHRMPPVLPASSPNRDRFSRLFVHSQKPGSGQ